MKVDVKKLEADIKRIKPNEKVAVINCRSGERMRKMVEALSLQHYKGVGVKCMNYLGLHKS